MNFLGLYSDVDDSLLEEYLRTIDRKLLEYTARRTELKREIALRQEKRIKV